MTENHFLTRIYDSPPVFVEKFKKISNNFYY